MNLIYFLRYFFLSPISLFFIIIFLSWIFCFFFLSLSFSCSSSDGKKKNSKKQKRKEQRRNKLHSINEGAKRSFDYPQTLLLNLPLPKCPTSCFPSRSWLITKFVTWVSLNTLHRTPLCRNGQDFPRRTSLILFTFVSKVFICGKMSLKNSFASKNAKIDASTPDMLSSEFLCNSSE